VVFIRGKREVDIMVWKVISQDMLTRMIQYYNYLEMLPEFPDTIPASALARELRINEIVVRKDFEQLGEVGKQRPEYDAVALMHALREFLGYDNVTSAVLAGAGNLGKALLSHTGFANCGIKIEMAFDVKENLVGEVISGVHVLHASKMADLCQRMGIHIGIIAVAPKDAQTVCDQMVLGGIIAILNFAPVTLRVPKGVKVYNEQMEVGLTMLSHYCRDALRKS
jgi:redox-sensing transcriptional repressor